MFAGNLGHCNEPAIFRFSGIGGLAIHLSATRGVGGEGHAPRREPG
jgi:hypothetical protein